MSARGVAPPGEVHDLDPQAFLEEVQSFEFWFQAVEGYLSGLTFGHRLETDPVKREVLQGIIKDERRHIGFGENELGRRLAGAPHIRARLGRVKQELDHLVLDTLDETMNAVATPAEERHRVGRAYRESVERLGFT